MKWIHDNENCCSINVLNITTVWPSKVLWWPISWLPFVQEVTCIHQAPSHYLNQCLLMITGILWYSFVGIFTDNIWIISQQNVFKFYTYEIGHISPRVHWVNPLRLNNAIWIHRSGQTLTQVMACCLVAPSHYLHRYIMSLKILFLKLLPHLPGVSESMMAWLQGWAWAGKPWTGHWHPGGAILWLCT